MALDQALLGRTFPPTRPFVVTEEHVRAFAEASGSDYRGGPAPATYAIVIAFAAMNDFLASEELELQRIVHGDQGFEHHRQIVPGDELTATLSVTRLRQMGDNAIISTASEITDASGDIVCTTTATLVHRGDPA